MELISASLCSGYGLRGNLQRAQILDAKIMDLLQHFPEARPVKENMGENTQSSCLLIKREFQNGCSLETLGRLGTAIKIP